MRSRQCGARVRTATRTLAKLSVGTLGLALCAAASAQEGEAPAEEGKAAQSGGIEQIVVTAEKRETTLQTTPVAISAFSEGELDRGGYEDLEDLSFAIPNVQFGRSYQGTGGITIRGISSSRGDRSTAFHVDGVYRNEARPSDSISFFDVRRVEVLRGPQGSLYGRNATGGSVNVVSNPPSPEFEAGGDVQLGTYDQYRTRAFLNVPVYEDKVMTRLAFLQDQRDGFQRNGNAFHSQDMDDEGVIAGRAQVRLVPVPEVDLTLRTEHTHRDVAGVGRKVQGPFPPSIFVGSLRIPDPRVTDQTAFQGATPNPEDPRRIFLDLPGSTVQDDHSLNGTLTWDFYEAPLLGDFQLTAIGSWFDLETQIVSDEDQSDAADDPFGTNAEFIFAASDVGRNVTEWVGEVRAASLGSGPFQWILGAFYLNSDVEQEIISTNVVNFGSPPARVQYLARTTEDAESIAGFLRGSYTLWDELTLTAGFRYTYDVKHGSIDRAGVALYGFQAICPLPEEPGRAEKRRRDWKVPTGEVRAEWLWRDDNLLYVTGSRGYKAGVVNTQLEDDETLPCAERGLVPNADKETLWAAEVGSKNRFLDNRLQANLTGFYYDYSDFQFSQVVGTEVVAENAPEATLAGLEAEFVLVPDFDVPLPNFVDLASALLSLNVSYLYSNYDDFENCTDPFKEPTGRRPDRNRKPDCSGNDLIYAPAWTVQLAAQYKQDLGRFGSLTPRVQFFASDSYAILPFGRSFDEQDDFTKTDLRLTWRDRDERFYVEGFVENLEDEDVKQTAITATDILGGSRQLIYDRPRTAGIRLGAHW
jgi:iron complex outermembrane receptor protein